MTQEERDTIMKIVSAEGNVDELKELKEYIQNRISAVTEKVLDDSQIEILTQPIQLFFRKHFPASVRSGMSYVMLCNAIGRAKHLKSGSIRVYDALGLDLETLKSYGFGGTKSWDLFETKLNEYGLSTAQKLSANQIAELTRISRTKPDLTVVDRGKR